MSIMWLRAADRVARLHIDLCRVTVDGCRMRVGR